MGKEERKKREKKRRCNQIIDAAEQVIFSKGLEKATMDEIAEEAELSKGTLYLYFENKTELYIAITQRGSDMLNSRFTKIFSEAHDQKGLELIREMGETYLDFVREYPNYFTAFMYYESLSDLDALEDSTYAKQCNQNKREDLNFMVRALQIGMQDGSVDDSYEPKELATIIFASTRGLTAMAHASGRGLHAELLEEIEVGMSTIFENFLNLLVKGMASEKELHNSKDG
ncbi:transcriptional regulator, TetR family [Fodinibius salinus]|uniref:Transcriptional regulator, TetR family n=1 Tax=Fodinibius salinus TaxID=860790 RepID=A0A5D3YHM9_9BACT|nr:TetR/AcrR family transcriptional regulator [Fodinibius salinus]TYP93404.1 transcriptional regulator, TetR family [Fodinibius salinus]